MLAWRTRQGRGHSPCPARNWERMRWQHAQLGWRMCSDTDEGLLGCVVGLAGGRGMFSDGTWLVQGFAWSFIPLNSSNAIKQTHCLNQECRMETLGSSPGLIDLCLMLFIPRSPFQTLLPEPSQSLLVWVQAGRSTGTRGA